MQHRVLRVLRVLLAGVSTLLAMSSSAQSSTSGSSSIFSNTTISDPSVGSSEAYKSQCELCRDEGDCAQAYLNRAGVFCGSRLDNRSQKRFACCCPASDGCSPEPTEEFCCQYSTPSLHPSEWIWISFGAIAITIAVLIAGRSFMATKKRRTRDNYETDGIAYSQPVYIPAGYAQQGFTSDSNAETQGGYAQPRYIHAQLGAYGQGGDNRQGGH